MTLAEFLAALTAETGQIRWRREVLNDGPIEWIRGTIPVEGGIDCCPITGLAWTRGLGLYHVDEFAEAGTSLGLAGELVTRIIVAADRPRLTPDDLVLRQQIREALHI